MSANDDDYPETLPIRRIGGSQEFEMERLAAVLDAMDLNPSVLRFSEDDCPCISMQVTVRNFNELCTIAKATGDPLISEHVVLAAWRDVGAPDDSLTFDLHWTPPATTKDVIAAIERAVKNRSR